MEDSPYQSPALHEPEKVSGEDGKLLRIAKYQRWVLCALFLIGLVFVGGGVRSLFSEGVFLPAGEPLTKILVGLIALLTLIAIATHYVVAILSAYLLTKQFASPLVTGLVVLSQLIPCISLLVLLALYVHATLLLESKGLKVGFLGVSQKSLRRQLDHRATSPERD